MSEIDIINHSWETGEYTKDISNTVNSVLKRLDEGNLRVVEKKHDAWIINEWAKKAILLSFKLNKNQFFTQDQYVFYDKVPLKFSNWREEDFQLSGIRAVYGSIVRYSAYIAKNTILMPCFVNVGAYIDENTMIDSGTTIGSCAHIGKNCHISSNNMIGGVLEPIQNNPVIIEDNCFIGAGCNIAEGILIEQGSVVAMNVSISASTKIYNRMTKEITYGKIPAYSVVVPGSMASQDGCAVYAPVIVKQVDEKTRNKTSINDLLRNI